MRCGSSSPSCRSSGDSEGKPGTLLVGLLLVWLAVLLLDCIFGGLAIWWVGYLISRLFGWTEGLQCNNRRPEVRFASEMAAPSHTEIVGLCMADPASSQVMYIKVHFPL